MLDLEGLISALAILDTNPILKNGWVQNISFFLLDIVVLTIAVPIIVRAMENQKWKPARAMVRTYTLKLITDQFALVRDIRIAFDEVLEKLVAARRDETKKEQVLEILDAALNNPRLRFEDIIRELDAIEQRCVGNIQLCAPALDANIVISVNDFVYEYRKNKARLVSAIYDRTSNWQSLVSQYKYRWLDGIRLEDIIVTNDSILESWNKIPESMTSDQFSRWRSENINDLEIGQQIYNCGRSLMNIYSELEDRQWFPVRGPENFD